MKRVTRAVMNCNKKSATAVFTRGGQVKSGLTTNAALFTGTAGPVAILGADLTLLGTYIGTAKGNSVIKSLRDVLAAKVYAEMQALLPPVNTVAAGNEATIGLSGFAASADSTPQAVPNQVIIKRIVPGKEDLSAKIFIESLKQPDLTFVVRTTTVAGAGINDPSWVTVLEISNSKKLILTGLVKNQEIFIDVKAKNKRGVGMYSDAMSFSAHSA
jgi:hypothetical protein